MSNKNDSPTKSLLEGVELLSLPPKPDPSESYAVWQEYRRLTHVYMCNLQTALIAALRVIDEVRLFIDDETYETICKQSEYIGLETALKVFRKEGV